MSKPEELLRDLESDIEVTASGQLELGRMERWIPRIAALDPESSGCIATMLIGLASKYLETGGAEADDLAGQLLALTALIGAKQEAACRATITHHPFVEADPPDPSRSPLAVLARTNQAPKSRRPLPRRHRRSS